MARPVKGGLKLSWHEPTSRWYRTIGGKREYFGRGKSKSDREGYNAAVQNYKNFITKFAAEQAEAQQKAEEDRVLNAAFERRSSCYGHSSSGLRGVDALFLGQGGPTCDIDTN